MIRPIYSALGQLTRRVKKRFSSRAVILMYHRVAELSSDPWSLAVTPTHFADQLAVLRKYGQPISLQQLVQAHENGRVPHRSIVLTFDDGYADNLLYAKPLLEQFACE